jgi:hypothetical protein
VPSIHTALERIVIVPVNGYANRLQAWASASILGASIGVPVSVHWRPQDIATSPPEMLFDDQLIKSTFTTSADLPRAYADPLTQVPVGLHFSAKSGVVTLAGRERGEQVYMPELMQIIDTQRTVRTLIIVAGGLFNLEASSTFTRQRQGFYRSIAWDRSIQETVERLTEQRGPYLALHSRKTDRSLDVATSRSMRKALKRMAQQRKLQSIFITADSQSSKDS